MVDNLEAGDDCDDEADEDHNEDTGDKHPDPDWKLRHCLLKLDFIPTLHYFLLTALCNKNISVFVLLRDLMMILTFLGRFSSGLSMLRVNM